MEEITQQNRELYKRVIGLSYEECFNDKSRTETDNTNIEKFISLSKKILNFRERQYQWKPIEKINWFLQTKIDTTLEEQWKKVLSSLMPFKLKQHQESFSEWESAFAEESSGHANEFYKKYRDEINQFKERFKMFHLLLFKHL